MRAKAGRGIGSWLAISVAAVVLLGVLSAQPAMAQDNYEIQVYGSDTVPAGNTMVELHSNFTVEGFTSTTDGTLPDNHAEHETVEITHGFTDWFETGFYVFTSGRAGSGWSWVGDHIRPRFRVPDSWHWPVGVSISQEFGYVRPLFSADTWTYELRPILDQKVGRFYWAVNPALEKSFRGPSQPRGVEFSPAVKLSWDITPQIAGGLEYYASVGPMFKFDPFYAEQQQFFPTIDLNVSPKWEFNFGAGWGVTRSTDHLIVKGILGYRFDF
jgi:hypothetical protein